MSAIDNAASVACLPAESAVGCSWRDDASSRAGAMRPELRMIEPMPNPMRVPMARSHMRDIAVNSFVRQRPTLFEHAARTFVRVVAVAIVGCTLAACRSSAPWESDAQASPDQSEFNPAHYGAIVAQAPRPPHKWTKFVSVRGQPEPVPFEWVATPEGKFAHDIVIPNPVPKDSGYKRSMSATEYFLHLCEKEAGEFVYKTVKDVPGFLFMRIASRAGLYEMKDRYWLEAPGVEREYEGSPDGLRSRAPRFVSQGSRRYSYYEEPFRPGTDSVTSVIRKQLGSAPISGFVRGSRPAARTSEPQRYEWSPDHVSGYGVTWRGIKRHWDREDSVAGSEVLVLDLATHEVLGVKRFFVLSGRTRGTRDNIWWVTAANCPQFEDRYGRTGTNIYEFVERVLTPAKAPVVGEER